MNTTPKTPLVLLADAADELHKLADRLTDAAEELLPETPTPAPLVLPTVEEVSAEIAAAWESRGWYGGMGVPVAAQAILDLIAARVPVWVPVKAGTVIKAGTRYRVETSDGECTEGTYALDLTADDARWYIFSRTVPAEPEDPRVAVVLEFLDQTDPETWQADARDLLARLDAVRADA